MISSNNLVPGDILLIPNEGFAMPCDGILLNGRCVVSESLLTGESTTVLKRAIERSDDIYQEKNLPKVTNHTLFCGTNVI